MVDLRRSRFVGWNARPAAIGHGRLVSVTTCSDGRADRTDPVARDAMTVTDDSVDVVVEAAQVFAAVTAEAIAQARHQVTLPQLRVLTIAAESAPLRNVDVARALNIHISNASRLCDRLVQAGLLDRRGSPADRRQVELTVTAAGRRLLDAVTLHRRTVFARVLARMNVSDRDGLVATMTGFVAAGEAELEGTAELP